MLENNIPEI